jgi:hypothetical protein
VSALDFENGVLYGFTQSTSQIITINTQTGAGTFLVNESGTSNYIDAVATAAPAAPPPPAPAVPEPSSLMVFTVAVIALSVSARLRRR